MKKIFVVALGIALCLTFAASASAIDSSSLESRTTEGLFDRSDAFDLARHPGELYKVKPLHLWTVGSGYSGPDDDHASDSFLVGVARELGPGSFAVFFETNNNSYEASYAGTQYLEREDFTNVTGSGSTGLNQYWSWDALGNYGTEAYQYPAFDGQWDTRKAADAWLRDKYERTEYNFALAYSWDFSDTMAFGLGYEPQFVRTEETIAIDMDGIGMRNNYRPDVMDDLDTGTYAPWGTNFFDVYRGMPSMWFWGVQSGKNTAELFGTDRHAWLDNVPPVYTGSNWGGSYGSTYYPDVAHTTVMTSSVSESFEGEREDDQTVHPVELEGHFRPNDSWDILVGVGYATVEDTDVVSGQFALSSYFTFDDPEGIYEDYYQSMPMTSSPPNWPDLTDWDNYESASLTASHDMTFTVGGSLRDLENTDVLFPTARGNIGGGTNAKRTWPGYTHADDGLIDNGDGNRWSIYISPTYHANDMHSFRLDLGYSSEDGDFNGGLYGVLNYDAQFTGDINGEETYYDVDISCTADEIWDGTSTGDYEQVAYFVEPRWYVNFDKVRFSAGLGWGYSDYEWDGIMTLNKTTTFTWVNNSGANYYDSNEAGSAIGGYTSYTGFRGEISETTWRAPVAVEFDITEKLTARAGAAYYRVTTEIERQDSQEIRNNEWWEEYDEAGVVVDSGPADQVIASGADDTPYDAWDRGSSFASKLEDTVDFTTYNLGLGYYFTENLQFDLMFSGQSGWVDSSQLFGSFTVIFP
jgi:hypothetical protein